MAKEFGIFRDVIEDKVIKVNDDRLRERIKKLKETPFSYRAEGRENLVRYCEVLNDELLAKPDFRAKEDIFNSRV